MTKRLLRVASNDQDTIDFVVELLFDADPKKVNSQVAGLVIKPLSDLEKYCEKFNVAIGIIATPGQYAQEVADELINCGVRSILNFAPVLHQISQQFQNLFL